MDIATQTHLTTLRGLLTYRLRDLLADAHAAQRDPQVVCDVYELAEVDAALHRLDIGVYGDCTQCGEPISLQRLLVQPAAQRCARCEAKYEH
jgi:DnaK suppressor protein